MEGWKKGKSERKEGKRKKKRNSMRDNYWDFWFFEFNGGNDTVLYCIFVIVELFFDYRFWMLVFFF